MTKLKALLTHQKWISPPSFSGRTWSRCVRHTTSERLFFRIFPIMFGNSIRRQVVVVFAVSRSDTEERRWPRVTDGPTEILLLSCPFVRVWRTKLSIFARSRDFERNQSTCLSCRIQSTQWNFRRVSSRLLTVSTSLYQVLELLEKVVYSTKELWKREEREKRKRELWQRERETETDRDRQRQTETERQRERERERERERHTHTM
jgi:hypothetical protein